MRGGRTQNRPKCVPRGEPRGGEKYLGGAQETSYFERELTEKGGGLSAGVNET